MFLANTHDEGMEILPTHRVLPRATPEAKSPENVLPELTENFDVKALNIPSDLAQAATQLSRTLAEAGADRPAFIVVLPGGPCHLLTLREGVDRAALLPQTDLPDPVKALDVTLLDRYLLEAVWLGGEAGELGHDDLTFVKDAGEVLRMLRDGEAAAGFLLNPTRIDQVIEIAGLGMRMPQKSTYFYPKIITGMVMRDMNPPD
jgi:hypothetical protein